MYLFFFQEMVLFIRPLVPIHPNKLELAKEIRHILDVARTLMIHIRVSKWSDAVLSACYLINRMLSSVLNKSSPFSYLYANETPFFATPRVFGCICFVQTMV